MSSVLHAENPHAGQGSAVLLDIGGDIGALVVTMPSGVPEGEEVEIRPEGAADHPEPSGQHGEHGHSHHPHVAVVHRPLPGGEGVVPSLVFGELVEGRYELYPKGTHDVRLRVEVVGGQVATAEWPD